MKISWIANILTGAVVGSLISCSGGGGSGGGTSTRTTGYDVPSEISPVPTDGIDASIVNAAAFSEALKALLSIQGQVVAGLATDAGTDYTNAKTMRFVSEHSIDQFDIIETILNAMAQTHYTEAENINAGPYKNIVSWQENKQGAQTKSTMTWIVDSAIIQENGQDVNRLRAWIQEADKITKAEFKIYTSATKREDGSYQDYGVWTLNVKFNESGTKYFTARASIGPSGETILSVNETGGGEGDEVRKATMHKAAATGYGKVSFPEWQGDSPVQITAAYIYNADQLRVHSGSSTAYKDRASKVEINHRYGMYDSVTGEDVLKSRSFGFPVSYQSGGSQLYGYYGAWQGRHQLWAGQGNTIADNTTVTRQDRGSAVESYKTISFTGTLTKRTLVTADISDLLNIPVETWINFSHQLIWDGSQWTENSATFTDFASLASAPRKSVWINKWGSPPTNYVYLAAGPSGAGFYVATQDPDTGQLVSTGVKYNPAPSDQLWVNVGGSIYIEYKGGGTGWVQKTVTAFDERKWIPTFDPSGDLSYTFELDRQYYINKQGGNYVITRTGASSYTVKIEIQTAANPANLASLLGSTSVFKPQWFDAGNPGQTSTYQFITDDADPDFLKLVYATVGTQDQSLSPVPSSGDIVTQGQWGLMAYNVGNTSLGIQFNWDYPCNGGNWGTQTFLYSESGGDRTYKLLDDPIQLQPLTLGSKTFSLQYDGWMHGMPEYFDELSRNNWVITDDIADKIINIPEGTLVTSSVDTSKSYLIKPLEIGLYLKLAATPDATLDITDADAIDLTDPAVIPVFEDHHMGTQPDISVVKYSEGTKIE